MLVAFSQKISLPWKINNCNIYQIWGKNPCFCTKFKNCSMCFTLLNSIYGRESCCTGSNHKEANVLHKFLGRKMIFLEFSRSLACHSSVWSSNVPTFLAQRKYMLIIELHKILVMSAVLCCTFISKGQISSIQDTIFQFLWQKLEFFQEKLCKATRILSFAPENPWGFFGAWGFFCLELLRKRTKKPALLL